MNYDWKTTELICSNCRKTACFRYAQGHTQFNNGLRWVEIAKSAEIVLCANCGASIYISSVKVLAES